MKKKPLVPQAQILWFSVLHQLSIPGLSPLSQQPPAPATDADSRRGRRCPRAGQGRARRPLAEGAPYLARGRHFQMWFLHIEPIPAKLGDMLGGVGARGCRRYGRDPRGIIPPPQPALGHVPHISSQFPRISSPAPGLPQPSRGRKGWPPASPPGPRPAQREGIVTRTSSALRRHRCVPRQRVTARGSLVKPLPAPPRPGLAAGRRHTSGCGRAARRSRERLLTAGARQDWRAAGAQPDCLTHPEPAAVVALMELMRSRLAVSFRACRVCWSGLW